MLKRGKGIATALFNLYVGRFPSRRLRRFWWKLIFRVVGKGCFVGIRTQVMSPWNIELGDRSVVQSRLPPRWQGGDSEDM